LLPEERSNLSVETLCFNDKRDYGYESNLKVGKSQYTLDNSNFKFQMPR